LLATPGKIFAYMKRLLALVVLAQLILSFNMAPVRGQDEARALWQVTGFDISANVSQSERTLAAVATLTIKNVGRASGTGVTLRINSKAKVTVVTTGGAAITFHGLADSRASLQRLNLTLPAPVAPNSTVNLSIDYRLPVESNSGDMAISPIGSQFLPQSTWYPVLNTQFTVRGADNAPFKLKVEGANIVSSGIEKGSTGNVGTYEQNLNGQPFFLQGAWEKIEGDGEAKGITVFLPTGAPPDEKKQAESLLSAAAAARTFYAGLLGPAPATPIRLVAVRRGSGFSDAGTVLLEWGAFRRSKIDAATALTLSESIGRLWIGGQTPIHGEGAGVMREGLSRYLATLFIEKQFGHEAAESELLRERLAYATVAKREAPLARSSTLDDTYYNAVPNKSTMVWRLVERQLGREGFMTVLRTLLQSGNADQGVSLAGLRVALAGAGGEGLKKLLDQELDQATDMDLLVGLPQQRGADWVAALRNLGSIDAAVAVVGTTDRGEQIKITVRIPAQNFADAVFKTPAKIVRVEVDPDKLYPQLDYSNDVAPRVRDLGEAIGEVSRLFGAQDFAQAEAIARQTMAAAPRMQEARTFLARALLGQNKNDEADKLFRAAIDEPLPTTIALAWANVGLGEIALKKGQAAEAARRFSDAVRADSEYGATLAARSGRIRAEAAAPPPIEDAVRTFITQLDAAITSGRKAELDSRIVSGELVRFVGGVVGSQPEIWQTKVLRAEALEGDLLAVDVSIKAKELGREQEGPAVLILTRTNGAWRLAGIELFEVR
jgi:hypothetical protein